MPPGKGVFQATYCLGPISVGSTASPTATAAPPGPRNCGHAPGLSSPVAPRRTSISSETSVAIMCYFSGNGSEFGRLGLLVLVQKDFRRPIGEVQNDAMCLD